MAKEMKTFQRLTLTAMIAAFALLASGCSGNAPEVAPAPSAKETAAPTSTPSPTPTATVTAPALPAGITAKGAANNGKGAYLQTTIADTDGAMQYNPAITDDASKAHFSETDLAEAQKAAVRFIAEEGIDSTLNGGGNVDQWYEAHKDQIHPSNQAIMLADLKAGKDVVARESWMATKPSYSYVYGDNTPRVSARTITPTSVKFVEGNGLQGVWVNTNISYSMPVTGGAHSGVQTTTATLSYAVAKDAADGKWKIAAYESNFTTAEG